MFFIYQTSGFQPGWHEPSGGGDKGTSGKSFVITQMIANDMKTPTIGDNLTINLMIRLNIKRIHTVHS